MAYISKSIQDNHRVTIDDGWEVIYKVSFGTIVVDLERSNRGHACFRGP